MVEIDENDTKIEVKTENLRKRSKNPLVQLDQTAADQVGRHGSRTPELGRREYAGIIA